jgi:hypothetical protein
MKTFDVSKKHRVTLTFLLDEEVTPRLFAVKIARACGGGTLRPGEAVMIPGTEVACFITDETLSLPMFGEQWLGTRTKKTKTKPVKSAKPSRKKRSR